jgi:hypothetical protein
VLMPPTLPLMPPPLQPPTSSWMCLATTTASAVNLAKHNFSKNMPDERKIKKCRQEAIRQLIIPLNSPQKMWSGFVVCLILWCVSLGDLPLACVRRRTEVLRQI